MNLNKTDSDKSIVHLTRLCDFGGRLSGTKSEREALDYVREFLSSLSNGLLTIHDVKYEGWLNRETQLRVNNINHAAVGLPGCGDFPEQGINLEIVDCGRGSPEEFKRQSDNIKGRAVLVTHEYMFSADHIHRSRKIQSALASGAAAFIISNPWDDSGMVAGDASCEIPALGVSKKTGDALRSVAQTGSHVYFKLQNHQHTGQTQTLDWIIPSENSKHGLDDKEIILCAHIDGHSVSQSAMDNASGVAVVLALAAQLDCVRLYSKSMRILIFSAEERGLIGSEQYVASLSEKEKQKIQAVLNLDCIAGSTKLCAMISEFDYLRKMVLESSKISGIPVEIFNPIVPNSDHYNFAVADIPALRLIAGFGEKNSKLRHVLTSADKRELVTEEELDNTLKVVRSMMSYMDKSH